MRYDPAYLFYNHKKRYEKYVKSLMSRGRDDSDDSQEEEEKRKKKEQKK